MVTATFRFYGQLNVFLAPARRGRAFAAACARDATTKHMAEALGAPHTEIELVLVNGESAGFDRILQENDRVALYPKFEAFDISALTRLPARPAHAPRFVADAHLGGLARLLRMAGFDTLYDNQIDDGDLAALARRDARVALTRDRDLLKRREIGHGCFLHAIKPQLQLRELFERLDLAPAARPFTLCLHCNAPLRAVDKAAIAERLPPAVRARHADFSTCAVCDRIYWQGSHWERMRALLAAAAAGVG
jgi:uncharacterized protein